MKTTNIAFCYRGQIRSINDTLEMKERIMRSLDDYDVDIRFFGHSIATETSVYTQADPDMSKFNLRHTAMLDLKDIEAKINSLGVCGYRIFEHGMNYRLANEILEYWQDHQEFAAFLKTQGTHYRFSNLFTLQNHPPFDHFLGRNAAQKELYFRNQIEIGDFLSQYRSAGHSVQMAMDHCDETNWEPDIVVVLRWDAAFEINNLIGIIEELELDTNSILCRGLVVKNQAALMDDVAFVTDYKTAVMWMAGIDDRLYELLTDWRVLVSISEFDLRSLPHTFWNFLSRNEVQYVDSNLFKTAIMRPGVGDALDVGKAKISQIDAHCKSWNDRLNDVLHDAQATKSQKSIPFEQVKKLLGLDPDFIL